MYLRTATAQRNGDSMTVVKPHRNINTYNYPLGGVEGLYKPFFNLSKCLCLTTIILWSWWRQQPRCGRARTICSRKAHSFPWKQIGSVDYRYDVIQEREGQTSHRTTLGVLESGLVGHFCCTRSVVLRYGVKMVHLYVMLSRDLRQSTTLTYLT